MRRYATTLVPLIVLTSGLLAQDRKKSETGWTFRDNVRPFMKNHCYGCHDGDTMEAGIRVDHLTEAFPDAQLRHWQVIVQHVADKKMPPKEETQPRDSERKQFVDWVRAAISKAKSRKRPKHGTVRRMTVAQYRNTLRQLLGLRENLTDVLPPDGVSKDGFRNNGQTLLLSPLMIEAYFDIAQKALDRSIVDVNSPPVVQNFVMELGESINTAPCPDKLILGANSLLLRNQDFVVRELRAEKPFDIVPFGMQTSFRYIEGYRGNDTVRGWREYNSIYHAVFACMRGTPGYPLGAPYQVVPQGLLLRPAIPSSELFGQSSTYGPKSNFKISLRELPDHGNFKVTVNAARYDDGLLLPQGTPTLGGSTKGVVADVSVPGKSDQTVTIPKPGVYQIEVHFVKSNKPQTLTLHLNKRNFRGQLFDKPAKPVKKSTKKKEYKEYKEKAPKKATINKKQSAKPSSKQLRTAFLRVRLARGDLQLRAEYPAGKLERIVFLPLEEKSKEHAEFARFEKRAPLLGVHVGLRRDCGSTLNRVGEIKRVTNQALTKFEFVGAINNYPSPDVEKDNVNYLAGVREIGVRSEYTDGRTMPRLVIRSVEFEGPYYEAWPPRSHQRIFIESDAQAGSLDYAKEVIRHFATRAFRRPVTADELQAFVSVYQQADPSRSFEGRVKDALLVILTSPQFLFLIEESSSPEPEQLAPYELASKLSYFLWNEGPDERLLKLAASGELSGELRDETDRMINDARFEQFLDEFASQWLSLDKFDVVKIDDKKYPTLTRDTKTQLREEPKHFLKHLIRNNLSLRHLVQSDLMVANEVVAAYYGLGDKTENGFDFVAIKHEEQQLGGLLTQAGILAGLSNGRESNPVKRGAWLARKIVARPPADPPPNVPQVDEEANDQLTLRQKIEKHRNQKGCAACHSRIDPWGIPFEEFDAGGLFKKGKKVEAHSTLPDKTTVKDMRGLKAYLAGDELDRVAFSFAKHLASYAVGRSLSYNEIAFLEQNTIQLKAKGYPLREVVHFVVNSDIFQKK